MKIERWVCSIVKKPSTVAILAQGPAVLLLLGTKLPKDVCVPVWGNGWGHDCCLCFPSLFLLVLCRGGTAHDQGRRRPSSCRGGTGQGQGQGRRRC